MTRCVICDLCDTAGSMFNTVWTTAPMVWSEANGGFICTDCVFDEPYYDPDFIDDEEDEEEPEIEQE